MERREALKKVALLMGGAVSVATISAIYSCNSTERVTSVFKLTKIQKDIVAEAAEMIIPRSNTAGAKDVGVPDFIEMMILDCYKPQEKANFIFGINQLKDLDFMKMSQAERTTALKKVEQDTKELMKSRNVQDTKIGDNDDKEIMDNMAKGVPFWRLIKELTLLGYFTSERGVKENFEYNPVPGKLEMVQWKAGQKDFMY